LHLAVASCHNAVCALYLSDLKILMLQKKVCVLGSFGVGKTSLIRRYVESIFSETYLTTVGVKIDKKTLTVGVEPITLILWDIAGEDEITQIRMSYLRGAAGYFLVVDGTRAETLEVARSIQARVALEIGPIPFVLLLNKADMQENWNISESPASDLENGAVAILRTSAKTGEGVEEAFLELAQRMVQ
jgi:small GTP-binding protein